MEILEVSKELQTKKDEQNDVAVIILLYKTPNFVGFFKPFDLELCGKKLWKWVELACNEYSIKTTFCTPESDVLTLIKPMLTNKKYTLVLYSDTPLIQKNTIEEILTYARAKTANVVNLTRGFVFDTEYIKTVDKIQNNLVERFNEEDFITVYDLKQLEFVGQILRQRILDFHQKNGVLIYDTNSVFVDADVIIESGTIIEPNNFIKGKTLIGKNCKLESGNQICDSIVGENCVLKSCYVCCSKIEKNTTVEPFEKIINKM
ncbi:MAG: hypothetical protein PHQ62_03265 [Clostridia bacterium]|nr:hypothetical protein [Clostridia bacterium]